MGLETTNVITGLNENYPTTADAIQQGDDHIRLIKAVLKYCFPSVNASLSASMVLNVPAGSLAATSVQTALNELDSEKAPKDGTGASGTWGISISGNAATATNAVNAANATNASTAVTATTASGVADGAVSTSAKLAANVITNDKLARAGTAGQLLTSGGAGADPSWQNPPAGGVSSFNTRTGAVALTSGDVTAALTYTPLSTISSPAVTGVSLVHSASQIKKLVPSTNIQIIDEGNGSVKINYYVPDPGSCLHPYTNILTANGSKFLLDLRPGDKILSEHGFTTVLGIWESALGARPVVCINKKTVVTPGHLFVLVDGRIVAVDASEYEERDRAKPHPVKLLTGMAIVIGTDYQDVEQLQLGDVLQTPSGVEVVESIQFFTVDQPSLPVYSVVLENAKAFFADGLLVTTLD